MPDAVFDDPRLAAVYDDLDPDRIDLDVYDPVIEDLRATSALDIGCGTGTFAVRLADRGLRVIALDPAAASVEVARAKPGAERVEWIVGTADRLPLLQVDCAVMTANVAQVFLDDDDWMSTLRAAYDALRPGGSLIFEARRPEARAWEGWTKTNTHQIVDVADIGAVEDWVEVTAVDGELVTFVSPTIFHLDGTRIDSTSTLRFRSRQLIESQLGEVGFEVRDVRDAPDRPGREWIFLADRH